MSQNEIHVGDTGTVLTAIIYDGTTVQDLSGTTNRYFVFKKPDATFSTVTAAFTTAGTDGSLSFTSTASTFDEDGTWQLQAILVFASSKFYSDFYTFRVYPNLV